MLLPTFFSIAVSPLFAGTYEFKTDFEVTLDAANDLLATNYYSDIKGVYKVFTGTYSTSIQGLTITYDYAFAFGLPTFRIEKKAAGNVLMARIPAHSRMSVTALGSVKEEQYHTIIDAETEVKANVAPERTEAGIKVIPTSIPGVPPWLEDLLKLALQNQTFPIYDGKPFETLPSYIPSSIDLSTTGPYDSGPAKVLDDRIQIPLLLLLDATWPKFLLYARRSSNGFEFKIEGNVKAVIWNMSISGYDIGDVFGIHFNKFDINIIPSSAPQLTIEKGGSVSVNWIRTEDRHRTKASFNLWTGQSTTFPNGQLNIGFDTGDFSYDDLSDQWSLRGIHEVR